MVLKLYSSLKQSEQNLVFMKYEGRKIIFSTNVAESSITIDNIVYVIDCGFQKISCFDKNEAINRLKIIPVSKSNAL